MNLNMLPVRVEADPLLSLSLSRGPFAVVQFGRQQQFVQICMKFVKAHKNVESAASSTGTAATHGAETQAGIG